MFRVVSISLVLVVLVFARFTHSNNRTRSMILFQRVRAIFFFCGWGTFCPVHCFYTSCFLRKKSQRTAANFMCFTSSQHHDSHHRRRRHHHHHRHGHYHMIYLHQPHHLHHIHHLHLVLHLRHLYRCRHVGNQTFWSPTKHLRCRRFIFSPFGGCGNPTASIETWPLRSI